MTRIRSMTIRFVPVLLLGGALAIIYGEVERPEALLELWRPWAEIGAIATVMTAIMITGGIDLSVGSIVALASVCFGLLWKHWELPIIVAACGSLAAGMGAGVLNGALVVSGIAPLVSTLATMALYAGIAMSLSEGERIGGLPQSFCEWGQGYWFGLPTQFWLMIALIAAGQVLLHRTRWGKQLFAIGDNPLAADFAGVRRRRLSGMLYVVSGLVAGVVALAYTARGGAAIPTAGRTLELSVIACVVVGGTRVTGGHGGILQTAIGVAALANLDVALQLVSSKSLGIPGTEIAFELNANGRLIVVGALVIVVAVINERLGRASALRVKRNIS